MWSTVDGIRQLAGREAELVRMACAAVAERLSVDDGTNPPDDYGIDWFDQWEVEQKRWLLQRVEEALLSNHPPPHPAAMWEATIDVIFLEVLTQIECEIDGGTTRWRSLVLRVLECEEGVTNEIDLASWRMRVTQMADRILGVPSYQKAEAYRDRGPEQLARYLRQRGLPEDFLKQIPPWV